MKTYIRFAIVAALLLTTGWISVPRAQAVTVEAATPSATATPSQDIEALKERLATKVAELRDIVRRAVFGSVKSISVSSATIETKTKDIKIELADDIAVSQIIDGKHTTLAIEDISKDDPVTVFGTYDATLDLLKAKVIFIESTKVFEHIAGVVTEVDHVGFTITVKTQENRIVTVDIEKATKTNTWSKADGMAKGGFTKILVGDTVHVVGTDVPKKTDRISAARILDIGNLSGTAPTATVAPTPVSSDSATPKPTIKPTPKPTATP
jgi:hypothetical protein